LLSEPFCDPLNHDFSGLDDIYNCRHQIKSNFLANGFLSAKLNQPTNAAEKIYDEFQAVGKILGSALQVDARRRKVTHHHNVNLTSVDLDFPHVNPHAETSFTPARPSIIGFLCLDIDEQASRTGQTVVIDGFSLWSSLSHYTKKVLLTTSIRYGLSIDIARRKNAANKFREWYLDMPGVIDPSVNLFEGKMKLTYDKSFVDVHPLSRRLSIANHCFVELDTEPQILSRSYYSSDPNITSEEISIALNDLHQKIHQSIALFGWSKSRFLFLDNFRYMHGRMPYDMKSKRNIVIQQYKFFNYMDT
jgi:alpha-ketoglutarate-dependent taurine dioxygenase